MTVAFATRLLPARPDLAAEHLRGQVRAERFAAGELRRVRVPLLNLTATADADAERATQLVCGEAFTAYEERPDGWTWGQAGSDGYVGYVRSEGLGSGAGAGARSRVTAPWSLVYQRPHARARAVSELPCLAEVPVAGTTGGFARLRGGGFVPRAHLAPVEDWVGLAERLAGAPYLWGGRSARGIDCSGLVQVALLAAGRSAPRDSDMQAALLGEALPARGRLRRGDLVFWKGHVGIMRDAETLLHANAHHMAVASEPLAAAEARVAATGGGAVLLRRRP
ncbi:MAG TPA: NlpC/P60 family protein [Amaricoccus sp.]|nr:NlpC/P60 family protein [Amaricoccus sp.]